MRPKIREGWLLCRIRDGFNREGGEGFNREYGEGFNRNYGFNRERVDGRYNFRYSRNRRVCDRLTGISVAFASFILRM
jgi:hypothetical protein